MMRDNGVKMAKFIYNVLKYGIRVIGIAAILFLGLGLVFWIIDAIRAIRIDNRKKKQAKKELNEEINRQNEIINEASELIEKQQFVDAYSKLLGIHLHRNYIEVKKDR